MNNDRFCLRALLYTISAFALLSGDISVAQSPWTAVQTYRKTDTTKGKFAGDNQTTGSYTHQIAVYKLDDADYIEGDWYRIDLTVISAISRYRKGDNICGWYTDKVTAAFDLTSADGEIWELGPQSTENKSSQFFTVGGSLGTSGPGINASYSRRQEVADAGIKLTRNTVDEAAVWTANLQGCKNVGGIGYTGASTVAKSTYELNPSILVEVPEGERLRFRTAVGNQANGFVHQKDRFKNLTVTHYNTSTRFDMAWSCNQSWCEYTINTAL